MHRRTQRIGVPRIRRVTVESSPVKRPLEIRRHACHHRHGRQRWMWSPTLRDACCIDGSLRSPAFAAAYRTDAWGVPAGNTRLPRGRFHNNADRTRTVGRDSPRSLAAVCFDIDFACRLISDSTHRRGDIRIWTLRRIHKYSGCMIPTPNCRRTCRADPWQQTIV